VSKEKMDFKFLRFTLQHWRLEMRTLKWKLRVIFQELTVLRDEQDVSATHFKIH